MTKIFLLSLTFFMLIATSASALNFCPKHSIPGEWFTYRGDDLLRERVFTNTAHGNPIDTCTPLRRSSKLHAPEIESFVLNMDGAFIERPYYTFEISELDGQALRFLLDGECDVALLIHSYRNGGWYIDHGSHPEGHPQIVFQKPYAGLYSVFFGVDSNESCPAKLRVQTANY